MTLRATDHHPDCEWHHDQYPHECGCGLLAIRASIDQAIARRAAAEEATIRALLGQWVSGLEPVIARDHAGGIKGLTIAGIPVGMKSPIVVPNPDHCSNWPVSEINRMNGGGWLWPVGQAPWDRA